jgi:hypothetical protein
MREHRPLLEFSPPLLEEGERKREKKRTLGYGKNLD